MKFNKYEQENMELHNRENGEVDIKNSLLKIKVKDILKFLALLWIIFIVYKGYQFPMSKPVYDVDGITFGLGLYKAVVFPAIMYLILSSRLYKKLKEKFPKLNNIKIILVSLIIIIIVNNIVDLKLYGSIAGLGGFLIIYIPIGIVTSIISIISYLRKRKLKKYLEKDFYVEAKCDYESNEISCVEIISIKCNKCDYENEEDAKFCNQCGSILEQKNNEINSKFDNFFEGKKLVMGALTVCLLVICTILWSVFKSYQYDTGFNLGNVEKISNINEQLAKNDYDRAKKLVDSYYPNVNDQKSYLEEVEFCKNNKLKSLDEIKEFKEREAEEREKKALEELVKREFNNIVDNVNKIGTKNLTDAQLVDFVNQYMKFLDNHSDNYYDIYDIAIGNLVILKKEYWRRYNFLHVLIGSGMLINKPTIGMSKDEVIALTKFIYPSDINKTTTKSGTREQYVYYNEYLYFENGKLTAIQD